MPSSASTTNPAIKKAGKWEKLLLILNLRKKFTVEGVSMTPLLQPGETILVKRTKKYFPQDVVISEHPFRSDIKIVKKIEAIEANGRVKLIGVNPIESQHHFGLIQPRKIIGKVTSKLDGKTSDR